MPQDIPLEASDTLAFTPASLADLPDPPIFTLRSPTPRDKRFHLRLHREEGVTLHGTETVRREIEAGLKDLWTEEQFNSFYPRVQALWEASDDFDLQRKDDPTLVWSFDSDEEQIISDLIDRVSAAHRPLRVIRADNAEFGALMVPLMLAVVVKGWKNLDTPFQRDRGYLTVDCAAELVEAIGKLEDKLKLADGTAVSELFVACANRMRLDEEEAKNSDAPSPSETTPAPLNETNTSDKDGSSPESTAPSSKTRATASATSIG